ncbi:hypothetical protein C5470_01285 [Photorhabdus stackebrandtii]|uniref:Uncharacterized protein n=1 Tax=Photorhabdus stackebrandtii TaxID=1123042 RepID=A0A7X5TIR9_9GAMM|nr:hypothetical protein [Photorhabdus stackebrandtii]
MSIIKHNLSFIDICTFPYLEPVVIFLINWMRNYTTKKASSIIRISIKKNVVFFPMVDKALRLHVFFMTVNVLMEALCHKEIYTLTW